MADGQEMTGDEAGEALGKLMIELVEKQLKELTDTVGDEAAFAFAMGAIPVCSALIAKTMGAAYCIDYLDDIAKPLRDFLTAHGGPGVGVCQ